jgi:hypothetical protein
MDHFAGLARAAEKNPETRGGKTKFVISMRGIEKGAGAEKSAFYQKAKCKYQASVWRRVPA